MIISGTTNTSALLVMDFQQLIVEMIQDAQTLLDNTARAIAAVRAASMPVIYVVVGFRPGAPEISARNKGFSSLRASARFDPTNPKTAIHPAVALAEGDVIVTKHRISAFHGTDLDMILRAADVDTLVLSGIATSGVVLSTLRHAADADYKLVVLSDCCADADAEVHRVLMEKVFPRQAEIMTSQNFVTPTPTRQ